jgi:hypothetical protein
MAGGDKAARSESIPDTVQEVVAHSACGGFNTLAGPSLSRHIRALNHALKPQIGR